MSRVFLAFCCFVFLCGGPAAAQDTVSPTPPDSTAADTLAGLFESDSFVQGLPESALARAGSAPTGSVRVPQDRPSPLEGEADADRDGVPVYADWCPETPLGAVVDSSGCEVGGEPLWIWFAAGLGGLCVLWLLRRAVVELLSARRRSRLELYGQDAAKDAEAAASALGSFMPEWQRQVLGLDEGPDSPSDGLGAPMSVGPPVHDAPLRAGGSSPTELAALRQAGSTTRVGAPPPTVGYPSGGTAGFAAEDEPEERGHWTTGHSIPPRDRATPAQAAVREAPAPDERLFVTSAALMAGVDERFSQPLLYSDGRSLGGHFRRHPILIMALVGSTAFAALLWIARSQASESPFGSTVPPRSNSPSVVAISDEPLDPGAAPGTVPSRLVLVEGDAQRGSAGWVLDDSIGVRVEDANGVPVRGVRVFFEATVGGGAVSPVAKATDSTGVARAAWRLGRIADRQYVLARVQGYEDGPGVAFEALALPGTADRLRLVAGDDQRGAPDTQLDSAIVFFVADREGNPIAGAEVEFEVDSDDGSVTPSDAVSDTTGLVRAFLTLGRSSSEVRLIARIRDQPDLNVAARAAVVYPRLGVSPGVAAGGTHTCLLSGDGRPVCWGGNQTGQLGSSAEGRSLTPTVVGDGRAFASMAAGLSHSCGVTPDGMLFCWGDNTNGQLGTGDLSPRGSPTLVKTDVRFRTLAAGPANTCGISRGGALYCWGSNASGQLGDGTHSDRLEPSPTLGGQRFTRVAVGWSHTCALSTQGAAYCWGRNAFGQLGDGSTTDQTVPAAVAGGRSFRAIATGSAHSCGVSTAGELLCWGQNNHGQLGVGGVEPRSEPNALEGNDWRSIAVGGVHSCGLKTSGEAFCWGRNTYGQLGDGTTEDRSTPRAVEGGLVFATLEAGGAHTCGTDPSGVSYCWGFNVEGQLGDGSRQSRSVPIRVTGG